MPSLSATIQNLASQFASAVLGAVRNSSLEDIVGEARGPGRPRGIRAQGGGGGEIPVPFRKKGAGRQRRSSGALKTMASKIVAYVKAHPGSAAEKIRAELKIAKNHWQKPVAMALESKKLTKKGAKRSTKYYA